MFCGNTAISGLPPSVSPMSASFDFWIVAEIANATRLRRSQPTIAMPIHLSHGRALALGLQRTRLAGLLGGALLAGSRRTFSRSESRSGLPS